MAACWLVLAEAARADAAIAAAIGRFGDVVAVAARNGPASTVLSGSRPALQAIAAELTAQGIATVWLPVSHAFHSPLMQPMLAPFAEALSQVAMRAPEIAFISTVTGRIAGAELATAGYWVRHARAPVRFEEAVGAMARQADMLIEIGPQPTLLGLARRCLHGSPPAMLASLRAGSDDRREMLASLARLYEAGAPVDWSGVHGGGGDRRARLPTYPFERDRHWVDAPEPGPVPASPERAESHPLLGRRSPLPGSSELRFTATVAARSVPFFDEHRLRGRIVIPAASHVCTVLLALERTGASRCELTDLLFPNAFLLDEDTTRTSQLVVFREGRRPTKFRLLSSAGDPELEESEWLLHAQGSIGDAALPAGAADLDGLRDLCTEAIGGEAFYARFAQAGYALGRSLTRIEALWLGEEQVLARVGPAADPHREAYAIYPGVLDACFQCMGVWFDTPGLAASGELFVPFTMARFVLHAAAPAAAALWVHAKRERRGDDDGRAVRGNLRIMTSTGRLLAEVSGFEFRRVAASVLLRTRLPGIPALFVDWQESAASAIPLADLVADSAVPHETEDGRQAVDALAVGYLRAAVAPAENRPIDADGLIDALAMAPAHHRLAPWLLEILRASGDAQLRPDGTYVIRGGDPDTVAERLQAARAAGASVQPAVDLLLRTGPRLAAVLSGEVSPVALLFPDGDMAPLRRLYAEASGFQALNATLAHVCSGLRSGGRFRVIEIGGGTGGSTSWVLDRLRGADVSYCFTDVSETFLSAARARFAAVSGFCARRLDIEQPPAAQGFAPGSFDLVIAANVVHATRDVRASLRHAVSLLAPGGCVVLLEGTSPRHWVDLTFGLTEGWWRFSDRDLRPSHPLLAAPAWEALLRECGLRTAMVPGGSGLLFDQALVVGRLQASGSAPEIADDWLLVSCGAETSLSGLVDPDDVVAALRRHAWAGVALLSFGTEVEAACRSVLRVMQDLSAHGFAGRVVLATRDAMAAAAADQVGSLAGAALWGLGAAAALEHPEWRLRRVDLPCAPEPVSEALWAELKCEDAEDQVAWRSGQRLVARLRHRSWPPELSCGMRYRGTWLITGGLGGLGLAVAGWLLERGVSDVVLVGRHLSEASLAAVQRLRTLVRAPGGSVVVRLADVRDRSALAAVVDEAGAALRGVVHAAGVLDDGVLGQLDWERFRAVLQPKVMGARNLHELTRDHALDAFVLFSSAASLLGNAGQASHAAANAYLDGLAQHRHAHALPALSINWGAWADIGSASGALEPMRRHGYQPISPQAGLEGLGCALQSGVAQVGLAPMDWQRVPAPGRPFLSRLRVAPAPEELSVAPPRGGMSTQAPFAAPMGIPRRDAIEDRIAALVSQVLGDTAPVPRDLGLFRAGLDSLMSVELRNLMQDAFALPLAATVAFDHPTINELALHLASRLGPETPAPVAPIAAAADAGWLSELEAESLIDAEFASLCGRPA